MFARSCSSTLPTCHPVRPFRHTNVQYVASYCVLVVVEGFPGTGSDIKSSTAATEARCDGSLRIAPYMESTLVMLVPTWSLHWSRWPLHGVYIGHAGPYMESILVTLALTWSLYWSRWPLHGVYIGHAGPYMESTLVMLTLT